MRVFNVRLGEILADGDHLRGTAEPLLVGALHYLENIPNLARTRADRVMAAVIRYYLK